MTVPLSLRFSEQEKPSELEVVAEAGARVLFRVHFRCRTGQTLLPNPDALLCLGLYPSSEVGAPLRVIGAVDAALLNSADGICRLFKEWWHACRVIKVDAAAAQPSSLPKERGGAVFFSGGVDSSFSLVEAQSQLSSIITLLGVDVPLSDQDATARLEASCYEAAQSRGLEPIIIETDVSQAFHPFASWIEHHGSALAAIGHMLSDHVGHVLIASSGNEATWDSPWGSHPALDPLFSSSRIKVEHHGLVSRFDKIARIAKDDQLLGQLRVCNRSRKNCGVCDKCTFAMRSLEILGFEGSQTFPSFHPRQGQLKVVDDAFLTEIERLHEAALEAGCSVIAEEAERTILAYRKAGRVRKMANRRWRSWARVMRHRWRWHRAST